MNLMLSVIGININHVRRVRIPRSTQEVIYRGLNERREKRSTLKQLALAVLHLDPGVAHLFLNSRILQLIDSAGPVDDR